MYSDFSMNFKKKTLPNGLRIITVPMKDNPAVMVLVAVETGSNYESKEENGLSHFLEHMCFKGTTNRPGTSIIARELDSLGAENNAFTSNEFTGYYAKAAKKNFPKLFEIISDLYLNPTLPAEDLEKERGVILQEISMYEDLPQRKVHDVMMSLLYGETSFGRPILGPAENIKKFSRDEFVNYRRKHYSADRTMVIVSGDVTEKDVEREVKKYFQNLPKVRKPSRPKMVEIQKATNLKIHHKKTDQTHMVLAFRMAGAKDKRLAAFEILSAVLGQGMSSRLFNKLRDVMGACYYVKAHADTYTDYGIFSVSTGVEAHRVTEVLEAILEECRKLISEKVSLEELNKAKEYCIGHLNLRLETSDNLAEFYMDQEVKTHKPKTPKEIEKELRAVRPEDVLRVARAIFTNERLNLAMVGNIDKPEDVKKTLKI